MEQLDEWERVLSIERERERRSRLTISSLFRCAHDEPFIPTTREEDRHDVGERIIDSDDIWRECIWSGMTRVIYELSGTRFLLENRRKRKGKRGRNIYILFQEMETLLYKRETNKRENEFILSKKKNKINSLNINYPDY